MTQGSIDRDDASALLPFHGLRFADGLHGGLAAVLGPPADITSSDEARAFVRDRTVNAIHFEIPDDGDERSFGRARELLDEWRRGGVLRDDPSVSYYVYDQAFSDHGIRRTRRGVFGLVPLAAPDVCVLPHEETWEDNRLRRLELLRDLDTSISPVFLIYEGADVPSLLAELTARDPDVADDDDFGNTHRLWCVREPEEVRRLRAAMAGRHFLIADGHHRYEAALAYHAEQRRPATGLVLACCVEATDPGIVIRPIYRTVHAGAVGDWPAADVRLAAWFTVEDEPRAERGGLALARSLPAGELPALRLLRERGERVTTLRLRGWAALDALLGSPATPAQRLDVSVLTELVLRRGLGLDPDDEGGAIGYDTDPEAVLAAVVHGAADAGILLRPARLGQVLEIARAHGRVPAKSTSFVPKVPVGLVMHSLRDEGRGTRDEAREGEAREGEAEADGAAGSVAGPGTPITHHASRDSRPASLVPRPSEP